LIGTQENKKTRIKEEDNKKKDEDNTKDKGFQ
jgi:hypothetical protein